MKIERTTRKRSGGGQRGAAMVEMAIITPLLLILVFGIIEFGVNFDRKISLNQGAREGARQAAVANFGSVSCSTSSSGNAATVSLVCLTKNRVGLSEDETRVKVLIPSGYQVGAPVTVCVSHPLASITGLFSPLTEDRFLHSKVTMRLEQTPTGGLVAGGEAAPTGDDWSWCS